MFYSILLRLLSPDIVVDFNKTIAWQSTKHPGRNTQEQKVKIQSLLLYIRMEIEAREQTVLQVFVTPCTTATHYSMVIVLKAQVMDH